MSKKRREKKARARNTGLAKRVGNSHTLPPMSFSTRLEDLTPPEGFRTIPAMQAMMVFAEPLRQYLKSDNVEAMNTMMGMASTIWNYTLPKVPASQKPSREDMVEQICETFGVDETDGIDLLDEMLERKTYLLPDEIQPDDVREPMFIRKEEEYEIVQFDESQFNMSREPLPLTDEDRDMLTKLRNLDEMLADGEAFDDWEDDYFKVEEACCTRYFEWLKAKDVPAEQANIFPYCLEVFVNFVYRYNGSVLNAVTAFEIEEFLMDHILRKVMVKPQEYVYWPPALRLFYIFLSEKGYVANPQPFIAMISTMEQDFIALLKKNY